MRRLLCACVLLFAPAIAAAQEIPASRGVFVTGPLVWSPVLALKEFGWDSNVHATATDAVSDLTATLAPGADVTYSAPHLKVSGSTLFDLIYYQELVRERAINRRVNVRIEAPLSRFVPFVAGAIQRVTDRSLETADTHRHTERDVSGGVNLLFAARAVASVTVRRVESRFDAGEVARGVDLATSLNRRDDGVTAALRINLTPLTSLVGDAGRSTVRYTSSPIEEQAHSRAALSLEFAPDAIIRGRAGFGYHRLDAVDPGTPSHEGFTLDANLSYTLLGVARFDGRYNRDTAASVEGPYYLQTGYGLEVLQLFIGPTELIARYSRLQADYPGSPARSQPSRVDDTHTYGGGFAIRAGRASRITVSYEFHRRRSVLDTLGYERQRVFTSVLLGF
jgi:hypothetical protein